MAVLEKISTIDDMKELMRELHRLEVKFAYDFYGSLKDFSSKKLYPQWLQKKGINKYVVSEKGKEVLQKVLATKRLSVIVYDLETEDCNGLEFMSELQKAERQDFCKVILVAPPTLSEEAKTKLHHIGARAVILRPITDSALASAFEKVGLDY